jgi:hypothetical protein
MMTDTKDRTHAATPARDRRFARQELDHQFLIRALPYEINNRLRYSHDPDLRLDEYSTRADVREVRHLVPSVRGIGPKSLAIIDAWLEHNEPQAMTKTCPGCGVAFEASPSTRTYCRPSCRLKHARRQPRLFVPPLELTTELPDASDKSTGGRRDDPTERSGNHLGGRFLRSQ